MQSSDKQLVIITSNVYFIIIIIIIINTGIMARTKMAPPRTGSKDSTGKAQGKRGRHDKTQGDDLEDPGSCFCETIRGGDVVSCDSCQCWCHLSCVGLSTVMFKVMSESEAPYFCPLCVLV